MTILLLDPYTWFIKHNRRLDIKNKGMMENVIDFFMNRCSKLRGVCVCFCVLSGLSHASIHKILIPHKFSSRCFFMLQKTLFEAIFGYVLWSLN